MLLQLNDLFWETIVQHTGERHNIHSTVLTLAAGNDDDGNGSTNLFELNLKILNPVSTELR